MTYYHWPIRKGEEHPFALLTEDQVKDIKYALRAGAKDNALADIYGVKPSCISQIRRGLRWKHVTIDPPVNFPQETS